MDTIELRGRAEFCLRLLQLWTDGSLAGRLSYLAARYHEAALRAEFGVPADLGGCGETIGGSVGVPRPSDARLREVRVISLDAARH